VAQGEFLGAKGYQTLRLDGEYGPFTVINTHLHARYRKAKPKLNSAVRATQLLQIIGEVHGLDGTVVIGGDFNCAESDPEYRIFKGLTGAVEAAEGRTDLPTISRTNFYKRHRSGRDKRIDFLFIRPGPGVIPEVDGSRLMFAEAERIRGRDRSLSDHFGFASSIGWRVAGDAVAQTARGIRDPEAFDLARGLLDVGREEANRREGLHLRVAGSWLGAAVLAASLQREPILDRRGLLRAFAGVAAFASLAPAIGYTALARVDSDQKRDAFQDAQEILALLEAASTGTT
jgi:hypothetical protein